MNANSLLDFVNSLSLFQPSSLLSFLGLIFLT